MRVRRLTWPPPPSAGRSLFGARPSPAPLLLALRFWPESSIILSTFNNIGGWRAKLAPRDAAADCWLARQPSRAAWRSRPTRSSRSVDAAAAPSARASWPISASSVAAAVAGVVLGGCLARIQPSLGFGEPRKFLVVWLEVFRSWRAGRRRAEAACQVSRLTLAHKARKFNSSFLQLFKLELLFFLLLFLLVFVELPLVVSRPFRARLALHWLARCKSLAATLDNYLRTAHGHLARAVGQ